MRNGQTHFERVPIEVVETIVRRAIALAAMRGKSPALVTEPDRQVGREFLKEEKKVLLIQKATMRKMIWVKSAQSEGWTCSECAWTFNPWGPPHGTSLDKTKQNLEPQRDKELASHVCAQHPRAKGQERGAV
jgi:hypothetical protein